MQYQSLHKVLDYKIFRQFQTFLFFLQKKPGRIDLACIECGFISGDGGCALHLLERDGCALRLLEHGAAYAGGGDGDGAEDGSSEGPGGDNNARQAACSESLEQHRPNGCIPG